MKKQVRNAFSPRERVQVDFADSPGRTKQSMRDECDINGIMRKFIKTGALSHLAKHGGHYGDFPPIDFHEAMNMVKQGEQMFAELPAKIRRRFHNEPEEFLAYVQDPANLEEMRELGLAKAKLEVLAPASGRPIGGTEELEQSSEGEEGAKPPKATKSAGKAPKEP